MTGATPSSGGGRPEPWGPAETLHLIDAYEERWHASRRGQLRAQQWEEVSAAVAARIGLPPGHPSVKTGTQCRHKVEKLRQRYRSERAAAALSRPSVWPFYARMHSLERGPLPLAALPPEDDDTEKPQVNAPPAVNGLGWNFPRISRSPRFFKKRPADFEVEEEEEDEPEEQDEEGEEEKEEEGVGVLEVVREFGEGLMRLERRRMEFMRELERERMEMEARRAEMVLESSRCLAEAIAGAFSAARKTKRPRGP